MNFVEKANEVMGQMSALVNLSLGEWIESVFMRTVTFFLNFLLGG